jgi:oligopeptide/dipeptide ABC transporter ATP-binding protein
LVSQALVEAVGLVRHYKLPGQRLLRAVDGVDLAIGRGGTLGLVGESGSGKSTLGQTLVGLQNPSAGEVRFEGEKVAGAGGEKLIRLRRERQIVFQDPSGALNPRMTLGDTIVEHLRVQGWRRAEARERAIEVLTLAGLSEAFSGRYPHEVSGGQRQRAVIARAISTHPAFIVADEPVSALDVSTRAQIMNLLRELQRRSGLTMLFISHDLSVVAHMCCDVAVMYLGQVVERAPRDSLFKTPLHPYTAALLSAIPLPDPVKERTRSRIVLKGETPDPSAIPSGCRFHTRCLRATEVCAKLEPKTRTLLPGHTVACHHPLDA